MTASTMQLKMIAALINAIEEEGDADDAANDKAIKMIKGLLEVGEKKS